MGRGKIEIKKIDDVTSRQVTFSKRKAGIFKKAHELSVLCDAEVAVLIFSNTGRLYEFASSRCMERTIQRYEKCTKTINCPSSEPNLENKHPIQEGIEMLRQKLRALQRLQRNMMGEELALLKVGELHELEHSIDCSILKVRARQNQIQLDKIANLRFKEQLLIGENEQLQKMLLDEAQRSMGMRSTNLIQTDIITSPSVIMNHYGGIF
nr:AGL9 [Larix kaempferi]